MLPTVVLCAAAAGAGASCYADPVNSPPADVRIDVPSPIPRGQEVTFGTGAHDPDGDRLTYSWSSGPGPCDADPPPPGIPSFDPHYRLVPVGDADGKVCVTLTVTDAHGARTVAPPVTITVGNQPPVAAINVQQPALNARGEYDLFSTFRLSAADSYDPDGDPLTTSWTLPGVPPASPKLVPFPCPPDPGATGVLADLVICLGPIALPGLYQVELVVNDPLASSAPVRAMLTVSDDRPPCITETEPIAPAARLIWDPAADKTFSVLHVDDDGDSWPRQGPDPLGLATFSWSLRRNAGAWQPIAGFEAQPQLTLPGGVYASGDEVDVRVEAHDRVPAHNTAACGDTDICPVDCPQRITWTVDYQ